jgi:DUF4097 and DUF4098 domain-containing protein YvlB
MMKHKITTTLLILIAGMIPAALSGCRDSDSDSQSQNQSGQTDSSGALSVTRMGGDINVTDAPHGATLTTMGGEIHLGNVASFAKIKTMGGNVTVDRAHDAIDAITMGGDIVISHAEGPIQATTMGGDIKAIAAGSSPVQRDIHLSSMGGTVTLTVPKDFPMDVKIVLTHTKDAKRSYHITDNVGLTQHDSDDWDTTHGSPRKYLRAEGRSGTGLNHVEIDTINGDVTLNRE